MANIDSQLAFIKNAKDNEANIAREAIADALEIMNNDRTFLPKELKVSYNGEYTAAEGEAYTSVVVEAPTVETIKFDGFVDNLRITKNGTYYARELYPYKEIFISGFTVDVPIATSQPMYLEVHENGEYEAGDGGYYHTVVVDVDNTHHEGDYLTAGMYFKEPYFLDPNNPNDATMIFIDKDDHILYGESALQFLNRLPKFKKRGNYIHTDWNPDPLYMINDQDFIPVWELAPYNYQDDSDQYILDYDVFLFIVRKKLIEYFYNIGGDIKINIDNSVYTLRCDSTADKDIDGHEAHYRFGISSTDNLASTFQFVFNPLTSKWDYISWNGDNNIDGRYVWSDGTNTYYSNYDKHYVLNRSNNTWEDKHWDGLIQFYGYNIWKDGNHIYHSYDFNDRQYELSQDGHTWIPKTWYIYEEGVRVEFYDIEGKYIWTDGTDIYYSYGNQQYILDRSTSTWLDMPSDLSIYLGDDVWYDGNHIYYNDYYSNLELDRTENKWVNKTWNDISFFYGSYIWTDGTDIYYSYDTDEYKLDRSASTWHPYTPVGIPSKQIRGDKVWYDGNNVYYSSNDTYFKNPHYCTENIDDITSETPVEGNNFYWWGCSLARAQMNGDRQILVRQDDIDVYDHSGWDIHHLLPQTLIDDMVPRSYYVSHPALMPNNYPYKHKLIPRKNLSIVQGATGYKEVINPTGNPQEQNWYEYNENDKTFFATTDTTVNPDKTYYSTYDSYTVSVDDPIISDFYKGANASSAWSEPELNMTHSPLLHINYENGRYVPYKKVNGQLVEYDLNTHIKYVRTHFWTNRTNCYLYKHAMRGVANYIKEHENLENDPPIYMENVYFMYKTGTGSNAVYNCVYLYDTYNKIYYKFNGNTMTTQDGYNSTVRYTLESHPQIIAEIDMNISNGNYLRSFEYHEYSSGSHGYIEEYDILPNENLPIYASGDFFEKDGKTFTDPETGGIYEVSFYSTYNECNHIDSVYFYNYDDIKNDPNYCPASYHYVRSGNSYVLERVSTSYNEQYVTENVEYEAGYTFDKLTDKIFANEASYRDYKYLYDPPYYNYINIINTPLIEYVNIIDTIESGDAYDVKLYKNGPLTGDTWYYGNRNTNRNIYADESTIDDFQQRLSDHDNDPIRYPLYSYDTATSLWQHYYDIFTKDYTLIGPHNSYNLSYGKPQRYDYIYFYL